MPTIFSIVALLCAVWVIYDVLVKNKRLDATAKAVWIICAILFSIVTAIVYYFIGRKK
jgi:uncharacterized protein with PQ loop repeat